MMLSLRTVRGSPFLFFLFGPFLLFLHGESTTNVQFKRAILKDPTGRHLKAVASTRDSKVECAASCSAIPTCAGYVYEEDHFGGPCQPLEGLGEADMIQEEELPRVYFNQDRLVQSVSKVFNVTEMGSGEPISRAKVTLAGSGSILGHTNGSGILLVEEAFTEGRNFPIRLEKEQYSSVEVNITANSSSASTIDVRLSKAKTKKTKETSNLVIEFHVRGPDGQRATEGATISSPNFDTKVTTPTGTAIVETNSPVSPGTLLSYTVSQPLRVSTGDRELEVPEDGSNFLLVEINMTLPKVQCNRPSSPSPEEQEFEFHQMRLTVFRDPERPKFAGKDVTLKIQFVTKEMDHVCRLIDKDYYYYQYTYFYPFYEENPNEPGCNFATHADYSERLPRPQQVLAIDGESASAGEAAFATVFLGFSNGHGGHNFYKDLPLYQHLLEFLNSDNETTASQSFTDVQQLERHYSPGGFFSHIGCLLLRPVRFHCLAPSALTEDEARQECKRIYYNGGNA